MNKFIILLSATFLTATSYSQTAQPYTWKSVQMVGGGFVDGIVFHPKAKGVRYCRTDMGGAYRWNEPAKKWEPLMDFISYKDLNLMGVESIALDPNDPNFVALACGTYTSNPLNAILYSNDKGKTFSRTNVPFRFGGNENGRGNGERMSVDPKNGNILYIGTRMNGLWKSTDRAKTWTQVTSFPDMNEVLPPPTQGTDSIQQRRARNQNRGAGIVVTLFDAKGSTSKNYSTIYAAASLMSRENFYKSTDDGATWQAVSGQPTQYRPTHAVLSGDGFIYLTYGDNPGPARMTNGAVWKYNTATGAWADITPDKPSPADKRSFGYVSVSVDVQNPQHVIVSSFNRGSAGGEEIFSSTNGGSNWMPVFKSGGSYDNKLAPYVGLTGIHWLFDIEIDPFDSNHAMFTTGYGGHETFDLTQVDKGKTTWSVMSTGIEETVALELLSPPKGANLVSAIGDYGGFVHWDVDKPEPAGNFTNPHFLNTDGVACGEIAPEIMVRVGAASHGVQGQNIGYSTDAGKTWQPSPTMPAANSQHGQIAVSADGKTWVWTPSRSPAFVTHDMGKTWKQAIGIADNLKVIADKVNPHTFYALAFMQGKFYTSTDDGNTFTEQPLSPAIKIPQQRGDRGDNRGGQDRVYAAPGKEGDLWISDFDGLYHSTNGGKTFAKNSANTEEVHAFGFGKGAPGSSYAALYVVGTINGQRGFFRSDDSGKKWIRINDDQHQYGLVLHITGDPKKYGRVYVSTHGRGTLYGDPVK